MHRVQHFKSNFEQHTTGNMETGNQPVLPVDGVQMHEGEGYVRNICFVWPDGRHFFLNYAYLVAGEFEPNTDMNLIRLSFSSYSIALRGYSLVALFMDLLEHLPRIIMAVDARYGSQEDRHKPVVIEMIVEKQKD